MRPVIDNKFVVLIVILLFVSVVLPVFVIVLWDDAIFIVPLLFCIKRSGLFEAIVFELKNTSDDVTSFDVTTNPLPLTFCDKIFCIFVILFLTVRTFVFCPPFISNIDVGVVVLIEIPFFVPYKYVVVVSACGTIISVLISN